MTAASKALVTKRYPRSDPQKRKKFSVKYENEVGRGDGQMVSVLAFYSDNLSSNPAEIYNFSCKMVVEKNKKRLGMSHFCKKEEMQLISNQSDCFKATNGSIP